MLEWPSIVVVSTSSSIANRSPGLSKSSVTARRRVMTFLRPLGVVRVISVAIGAAIPQRGSPPIVVVVTVPSGSVTRVTPSWPYTVTDFAPDGSVVVERMSPVGRRSASKVVTLPRSEVRVTRKPSASSWRA